MVKSLEALVGKDFGVVIDQAFSEVLSKEDRVTRPKRQLY